MKSQQLLELMIVKVGTKRMEPMMLNETNTKQRRKRSRMEESYELRLILQGSEAMKNSSNKDCRRI